MTDFTVDETQNHEINDLSVTHQFEDSYIFKSFDPVISDSDSVIDQIDIDLTEIKKGKKAVRTKKRTAKFDRFGQKDTKKDKRDIKKYAKFDTMNDIL